MINTAHKVVAAWTLGVAAIATMSTMASAQHQMPLTAKETIKSQPSITTEVLEGTVAFVEGNDLVVRISRNDIREFHVPETRRFLIDGRELTVHELEPGTRLTAKVVTTTTPVIDRTTTLGSGKVWFVGRNTVILTLPNGENRSYTVSNDGFLVEGQKATVADLRIGMTISAQKIVESPGTELASDTIVTGHAPPARTPEP